jgi:DUF4097 and DUF4098 domain-containing protein YvlB
MEGSRLDLRDLEAIKLDVHGDLRIVGHEKPEFFSMGDCDQLTIERKHRSAVIRTRGDCRLVVPKKIELEIERAGGNVKLIGLTGELKGKEISGDLKIVQAARVELQRVAGDAKVVDVKENVQIEKIDGDLNVVNAEGAVSVDTISGDVSIVRAKGDVRIDDCHGDCRLIDIKGMSNLGEINGDLSVVRILGNLSTQKVKGDATCIQGEGEIALSAAGDILISVSKDLDRKVTLRADGDVTIHFEGKPAGSFRTSSQENRTKIDLWDRKETLPASENTFTIGAGLTTFEITAGRRILLTQDPIHRWASDLEGVDIDLGLGEMGLELGEGITARIDAEISRANEKMVEAADKIARKVDKINRKAELRVNAALQKIGHTVRIFSDEDVDVTLPEPISKVPMDEPVSEQERTLILKMLQEKKITPEEAEKLFEALEGNHS